MGRKQTKTQERQNELVMSNYIGNMGYVKNSHLAHDNLDFIFNQAYINLVLV